MAHVTESIIRTAPWIFRSEVEVDISVDDCWKILMDDSAWQYWHPEVTDIEWDSKLRDKGASRTVNYRSILLMILLGGPLKIWEHFDIWEEKSDYRRMSFYFQYLSRPSFMTYAGAR